MTLQKTILLITVLYSITCQAQKWDQEKITVTKANVSSKIMTAESIFEERWDGLAQAQFWKEIMLLSPDSCIINVASSRKILKKMSNRDWERQSEVEKNNLKIQLKTTHNIALDERVYITIGKSDFYKFHEVYPSLAKGVTAFENAGVDPWYAQSILLIESPGQLQKSVAGAYGAFQLMPGVARTYGLVVNSTKDERKDFNRSAYAAAQLISRVCIPEAKRILDRHQLTYNESDLWFRLFVLHVYHAGAQNVSAVVAKIKPVEGSKALIQSMWCTTAASFGNNSQNYSQLALAAQLILNDLIYHDCDDIVHASSK
jgi:hypothetical protein